ncbi:MAG: phosphoribosylformylglycinamidine cyclo-ligase [Thermomicrobiaceae bacterium]
MSDRQPSGFTYQQAGVDSKSGSRAKERIGNLVRRTYTDGVLGDFGHFGGMFRVPGDSSQVLVSSADSVGTKVLLAVHAGRHEGIGIDLVNHSVNDILCCGAKPLFFLDYFATSSLDEAVLTELVEGMSQACRTAGCALIGGETAQLPGIYKESTYDLAGFIVGSVTADQIIDGSRINAGQSIVGFKSNGLHTNGYSLARAVFGLDGDDQAGIRVRLEEFIPELDETLGDALLKPHTSYLSVISTYLESGSVAGLAHVTGGGIVGNLERIIPDSLTASIDIHAWQPGPLFHLIQSTGSIAASEMFDVFNMGIGFIAVMDRPLAEQLVEVESSAAIIGEIRESDPAEGRVELTGIDG